MMEDGDEEEILLVHHLQAAEEVVVRIYRQVDVNKIQHLQIVMMEDQHGVDEMVIYTYVHTFSDFLQIFTWKGVTFVRHKDYFIAHIHTDVVV